MYYSIFNNKKNLWIFLFFFCLIISLPLYTDDLMIGHDTLFHATRVESIREGLATGNFPVKLYGYVYNDYGSPTGFFYPDLFLYIPAILSLIGVNGVFNYHLFLFLITLFTAIISFFSFNKLFLFFKGKLNAPYYLYGFAASVLYTGAVYRLSNLYARGALGEAIAMTFFPLALISFYLMLKEQKNAWIFVIIGASGVLESHLLSSFLLFIAYVIMSLCFIKQFFKRDVIYSILKASIFVVILNIWFYAPFMDMYNSFDFNIKKDVGAANIIEVMPWDNLFRFQFLIGILPLSVLFVYFFYVLKKIINKNIEFLDIMFIICFVFCIFFMLMMSPAALWDAFNYIPIFGEKLGTLQFAFRISIFTTFFISIALAIALCANKKIFIVAFIIPIVSLFWMISIPYSPEYGMVAVYTGDNPKISDKLIGLKGTEVENVLVSSLDPTHNPSLALYSDYLHNDISNVDCTFPLEFASKEYWEAVKNKALVSLNPNEITPENIVTNFSREGLNLDLTTNAKEETEIKLPLWYYPHCYAATCDGKEIPVFEVYHHRLAVNAPAGERNIKVFPKLHTPYKIACIISVVGLFLFIFVCVYLRQRRI